MTNKDREAAGQRTDDAHAAKSTRRSKHARIDSIRHTLAQSAVDLASSSNPVKTISQVLASMGAAARISRIRLYKNASPSNEEISSVPQFRWDAPGFKPTEQIAEVAQYLSRSHGPDNTRARLAAGEIVTALTRESDEPLCKQLQATGSLSILFVPIFINGKWWGNAVFDDCTNEREWSVSEIDTFKILAALIGTTIARANDISELAAAGRIIENSSMVLFRIGTERPFPILYISRNVSRYGYSVESLLLPSARYTDLIHPDDLAVALGDIARVIEGRAAEATRECRLRTGDGRYLWFECRITPVANSNKNIAEIEGLAIDIDRRKTAESHLTQFTFTDQLTGLANRAAFMERLRHAFDAAKRGANPFAVLYIDLDRFKDINDVLGHSQGDALLKLVAQRLTSVRRAGDCVARFGGDEFAVLQNDVINPSDTGTLAARILQELTSPSYKLGTQVEITASIGIAVFNRDSVDAEEIIKQADLALYRAKDLGRNQYYFHSTELDVATIERVTLASDLRSGIARNELELFYQPQIELPSGQIIGLEALVRWHHPRLGLLWPTRFIPIAEKTGIIQALGRWVIDDACRQIIEWRNNGIPPPTIAVNVSGAQIRSLPEFDSDLMQTLKKWDVAPETIELELTESVLMETTQKHRDIIDRLRKHGVAIAIDDFGTGYSSLEYLRAYRVNHIKIAQEFVRDLQTDAGNIAVVRAAISLARELGIKAIAEGIETEFQLKLLSESGCQYMQGFYFSPPISAAHATKLLRRGRLLPTTKIFSS